MTKSGIEWTEHTWNPIVGCSILSPGCVNCYAMTMARRLEAMKTAPHYAGTTRGVNGNAVWTGKLAQAPEETLLAPLRRKKPTTYFVNSMSDLFHESVPDEWIDRVFAVMALSPQHRFQVLTKRARRMQAYMRRRMLTICGAIGYLIEEQKLNKQFLDPDNLDHWTAEGGAKCAQFPWPLPNVWLGVSTERQQEADERIPLLLGTPAAVRFISAEPLLGPIDLRSIARQNEHSAYVDNTLDGFVSNGHGGSYGPKLDWVIVGGESGPGARPMHPDWARSLRDQCAAAGVPFFFKQWGNWHPEIDRDHDDPDWRQPYANYREPAFQILNLAGGRGFHGERVYVMRNCAKAAAGRNLDGAIHNGMPEVVR